MNTYSVEIWFKCYLLYEARTDLYPTSQVRLTTLSFVYLLQLCICLQSRIYHISFHLLVILAACFIYLITSNTRTCQVWMNKTMNWWLHEWMSRRTQLSLNLCFFILNHWVLLNILTPGPYHGHSLGKKLKDSLYQVSLGNIDLNYYMNLFMQTKIKLLSSSKHFCAQVSNLRSVKMRWPITGSEMNYRSVVTGNKQFSLTYYIRSKMNMCKWFGELSSF